jgi:hypothetical protein
LDRMRRMARMRRMGSLFAAGLIEGCVVTGYQRYCVAIERWDRHDWRAVARI